MGNSEWVPQVCRNPRSPAFVPQQNQWVNLVQADPGRSSLARNVGMGRPRPAYHPKIGSPAARQDRTKLNAKTKVRKFPMQKGNEQFQALTNEIGQHYGVRRD